MSNDNRSIVEDYWSKVDCSASEKNFYCFPPLRTRACKLIFNEDAGQRRDWCEYWTVEKFLKEVIPVGKCLSICCGFGSVERTLAKLNVAKQFVGVDIAPGAIAQARERAKAEGYQNIEYRVANLNEDDLPAEEYEIIWANGALHHIRELDSVVGQLKRALKPGGFLVSNEYVGPDYQQVSVRQQEIINAVRHLLPADLRSPQCSSGHEGLRARLKQAFCRLFRPRQLREDMVYAKLWEMPGVDYFLDSDPSECVKSSEIIPVLKSNFSDIDVRYFDGSILFYALDAAFYDNFDSQNPHHRKFLELLFALEDHFIAAGEIKRDNAHIICRKDA